MATKAGSSPSANAACSSSIRRPAGGWTWPSATVPPTSTSTAPGSVASDGAAEFCLTCNGHHPLGHTCAKREAQRYAASREGRARGSAEWKRARTLARQRDGNRCVNCGTDRKLQVHHRIALKDGGAKYDLANLQTLCSDCHADRHRGAGSTPFTRHVHLALVSGETQALSNHEPEIFVG